MQVSCFLFVLDCCCCIVCLLRMHLAGVVDLLLIDLLGLVQRREREESNVKNRAFILKVVIILLFRVYRTHTCTCSRANRVVLPCTIA